MTDEELIARLNILYAMLEEEGYYTKANTAAYAADRIEALAAVVAERDALRGELTAYLGATDAELISICTCGCERWDYDGTCHDCGKSRRELLLQSRIEALAARVAVLEGALLREKAAAYAQGYGDCEAEISLTEIGRTNEFLHGQIAKWKARAEQLAATNKRLTEALDAAVKKSTELELALKVARGGDLG